MWRAFPSVPHFSSVPRFFKCGALFQVCRFFFKCAAHFQVCRTFPSVTHFTNFGAPLISDPHFSKCDTHFFYVLGTFSSVPHFPKLLLFSKCGAFVRVQALFPVCRNFSSVEHFWKCAAFFLEWRTSLSVPHFFKCGTLFQLRSTFQNVSHISKYVAFGRNWWYS